MPPKRKSANLHDKKWPLLNRDIFSVVKENQDGAKELPAKCKLTRLLAPVPKDKDKPDKQRFKCCYQFPNHAPAVPKKNLPTIVNNCVVNSVIAIFLFMINQRSASFLKLAMTFIGHSREPATELLNCIVKGRGVSKEADRIRYRCAKFVKARSTNALQMLETVFEWFGLGGKGNQEQACRRCGTVLEQKTSDLLPLEDLFALSGKKAPKSKIKRCTNEQCKYKGRLRKNVRLPKEGFAAAVFGKTRLMKAKEIFDELALEIVVPWGKYKCFAAVVSFTQLNDISHAITLIKKGEDVLEVCDSAPFQLLRTLEKAGDQDKKFTIHALIYKGTTSRCSRM